MKRTLKIHQYGKQVGVLTLTGDFSHNYTGWSMPEEFKRSNYKVGSNQYMKKRKTNTKLIAFIITLIIIALVIIINTFVKKSPQQMISPVPVHAEERIASASAVLKVTPSATPTVNPREELRNKIDAEIKEVFGKHYDKAMLLLKGNGKPKACHENGGLDPDVVNKNVNDAGEVTSRDYGVFQINDKWQGVTNVAFLKDYHINIRMAWNIYQHHNYSFEAWTCGKAYKI